MQQLVPSVPQIIEADSLEAVILRHDGEYRELKEKAEEWRIKAKARWFSIGEKEYEENLRRLSERSAEDEEDENGALPPSYFYREELVPRILDLVGSDVHEFQRVSDLSLKVISAMYEVYVPQAGSKQFIIPTFFEQYFDFLHHEEDSTVLAVARMQASRANMHAEEEMGNSRDLNDYPLKSYVVQKVLKLFKGTLHQKYMADFLDICGGIDNGHILDPFLHSLPKVLERLEIENNEIVQRYLAFAKAEGFPNDIATFKFQDPACVDDVKIFDNLEENRERAVELYRVLLEKNLIQFHGEKADDLVSRLQTLENSRLGEDVPNLLHEAIELTQLGINGAVYLSDVKEIMTNTHSNRRVFLEMTRDLHAISPEAARSYFWRGGKEFTLPVALREKYHRAGMAIAREFGRDFTDYFESALRILQERPDRFEFWLERVAEFGRHKPALLNKLSYFGTVAVRKGNLDEMLAVVSYFDDRLHAFISTFDERVIGVDRDADFIREYHAAKKLRVNPQKLVETTLRLIETSDSFRPAYSILHAVEQGADFDKYVQMLPLIKKRHLDDVPMDRLCTFINSDYNYLQKEELLTGYALFIHDLREWGRLNQEKCPVLDPQGEWTNQLVEKLIAETTKYFDFDTSKFDVPDLMVLGRIAQEEFPHRKLDLRLRYILERRLEGKSIPKNMESGKVYATMEVEQEVGKHFDHLSIRSARGELPDILDTFRLLSHAFYPQGHQKKASLNYVLHPDVSLMHVIPKIGTEEGAPIGVAVNVTSHERESGRKYVLVDSVTFGYLLDGYDIGTWAPAMHDSIMQYASNLGAQTVLYNTSVPIGNGDSAEKFLTYLHNTFGGEHEEVRLVVARSPILDGLVEKQRKELQRLDPSEGRGISYRRTSWETHERVDGLRQMVAHYTGLHLRAWGQEHSMMADNVDGPGALEGSVQGLAFFINT